MWKGILDLENIFDAIGPVHYFVGGIGLIILWILIRFFSKEHQKMAEIGEMHKLEVFAKNQTRNLVNEHFRALKIKRAQGTRTDSYGTVVDDGWKKETKYFRDKVVLPDLMRKIDTPNMNAEIKDAVISGLADYTNLIEKFYDELSTSQGIDVEFNDAMDGVEFENYCANLLDKAGWRTETTKTSGDQGVDILARIDDLSVVIQCKRFSSPVGNSAVQEIFAGKEFEDADYAAVVTNNSYTNSAKQLAAKNQVLLLHYSELPDLQEIIGNLKIG